MMIQYQRNLKNSYMVITEQGQPLNLDGQLAEKMISRQNIPGLLSWVTMPCERDITFWYNITGFQSLGDYLQKQSLGEAVLKHIISALMTLQEELPRYYLKGEHLLLSLEQIFLDNSGEQVFFCYEPLWNKEPFEAFKELMEALLPVINHKDAEAVALGYGLYEKALEKNADVWNYLFERSAIPKESAHLGQVEVPQIEMEETEPKNDRKCSRFDLKEKLKEKCTYIWSQFHKKKPPKEDPIYLFEPQEEPICVQNPTVFLGTGECVQGQFVYQGAGGACSFTVTADSVLIGGNNDAADISLDSPGISRNHARITKEEENYYLEDLNSRNGTYLNGALLKYKQKEKLSMGDHVCFAREEFVFY